MYKRGRLLQLFLENSFRISPFRKVQFVTIDLLSRTHFLGIKLQKLLHWVLEATITVLQTIQANFSVKTHFGQARSWLEIFLFVHQVLLKISLKSAGTDRAHLAFPLTCTTASLHPNFPQFPSPQSSHWQFQRKLSSLPSFTEGLICFGTLESQVEKNPTTGKLH